MTAAIIVNWDTVDLRSIQALKALNSRLTFETHL